MRTFEEFSKQVRESVDAHAKRKNYTKEGPDGKNQLLGVMQLLNIHYPHAIGEIIYKCAEFLTCTKLRTKRLLAVKMAGWAFVIWREL